MLIKIIVKCVMLLVFIVATAICAYAQEPMLTIGIHYDSGAKSSYSVSSDSGFVEIRGTSATVSLSGGEILVGGQGYGSQVALTPNGGYVSVDGKKYRGSLTFKASGSAINCINAIAIEDYLKSVVPSEMPAYWEAEALKAQSVCARTYAMKNIGKHSGSGFDLCNTVHCQAYNGVSSETQAVTDAISWTQGQIVIYRGVPIDVFYFSSSGGYTESVQYVWGSNEYPYLSAVSDSYESPTAPDATWQKSYTGQELGAKLSARGVNIGDVTSVEIVQTSPNGAVTQLKVTGTSGSKTYYNEECRTFLGAGGMLSQSYTLKLGTGKVLSTTSGLLTGSDVYAKSAGGTTKLQSTAVTLMGSTTVAAEITSTVVSNGGFTFYGRGNGHLVGLSQYGAQGMAQAGFTYNEILTHYFTNTELLKAY